MLPKNAVSSQKTRNGFCIIWSKSTGCAGDPCGEQKKKFSVSREKVGRVKKKNKTKTPKEKKDQLKT